MPNSTTEDLILLMYNELNTEKRNAAEEDLESSWPLREKYNVLKESVKRLQSIQLKAPRPQTIEAIMQYAGVHLKEIPST